MIILNEQTQQAFTLNKLHKLSIQREILENKTLKLFNQVMPRLQRNEDITYIVSKKYKRTRRKLCNILYRVIDNNIKTYEYQTRLLKSFNIQNPFQNYSEFSKAIANPIISEIEEKYNKLDNKRYIEFLNSTKN